MTPLEEVLCGRDERAAGQREWISAGGAFVVQIALNIPGYPKSAPHDEAAVMRFRSLLFESSKALPFAERSIRNGAGFCWQGAFDAARFDAASVKRAAVEAENWTPAGRVLDIDVITENGAISRTSAGFPERSCLLCGRSAKVCARLGTHLLSEVRECALRLLEEEASEAGSVQQK
ncbi:MAG: citrate lyase holo-[Synergistes sp.]|nr:citrate lyase holo-[acyl-carrier protein] synthase [Synergistes sp.]